MRNPLAKRLQRGAAACCSRPRYLLLALLPTPAHGALCACACARVRKAGEDPSTRSRQKRATQNNPHLFPTLTPQSAEDVRAALESAVRLESGKASKAEVKAAWDSVASLASSAAAAVFQLSDAELAARSVTADDVLMKFCEANPDADECRVYDD